MRLRTRIGVGMAVAGIAIGAATLPAARATTAHRFVLSPEGNHLWAYDAATGGRQLLSRAVNGADPGTSAPNGMRRDINGQICVSPDGRHIVTGEDTVEAVGGGGGDSHDPRIAGWGWFSIDGDRLGSLTIEQTGKLAPEAGRGPGYAGDPDNFGCGFLDQDRLLTTAIGNTLPGEAANAQLYLWFGPFEQGFEETGDADVRFFVGAVDHCQIDVGLATAGGIAVAPNGDVYLATNRPDDALGPGAVVRYSGQWPTSFEQCTPAYLAAHITRTRVVPPLTVGPVPDPHAITPSAVVLTGRGTMLVSSVFSGTIAEYALDGRWLRDVYPTTPVAPPRPPLGDTPYGMVLAGPDTLFVADLGIVGDSPADGTGSLIRVDLSKRVGATGTTVRDRLQFPDGLGIYTP